MNDTTSREAISEKVLMDLEDGQLIRLVRANPKRISLAVRTHARIILKSRGYRFIGLRLERDEDRQGTLNFDCPQLTEEQQAVWNCIRERKGKGSEILGHAIAKATDIDYTMVRAIIAHLINHKGRNIGSNSKGYYIPITPEEITEATKSLRHRGIMILWRASKLMGNSLEDVFHQGRLEFTAEEKEAANQ